MIALLVAIVVAGAGANAPPVASTAHRARAPVTVADATATPIAFEEPAMSSLAVALVAQAQRGAPDRKLFNAAMNAALTPAIIASVSEQLAPLGKPTSITFVSRDVVNGYRAYRYRIVWPSRSVDQRFAIDNDGKIAGWLFKPTDPSPAAAPSAASPSASAAPTR